MQRRLSNRYGSAKAAVGHCSKHRRPASVTAMCFGVLSSSLTPSCRSRDPSLRLIVVRSMPRSAAHFDIPPVCTIFANNARSATCFNSPYIFAPPQTSSCLPIFIGFMERHFSCCNACVCAALTLRIVRIATRCQFDASNTEPRGVFACLKRSSCGFPPGRLW